MQRNNLLDEQEHILLDMIDKRGDVIDASTRNIRLPILMRPGGKFSQGTADFDDMGRGSGSTWDVGTLSTLHFRFAFEVSKLANVIRFYLASLNPTISVEA